MVPPLVSIILGCYNVESLILHGMESVLRQTHSNLEIWLVDDGSTDDTGTICDQIATKDSRVHVIHQANGGLAAARNAGLQACQGDYVYFCDVDDVLESDVIATMVDLASKHETDMIVFSMDVHDKAGGTVDHIRFKDKLISSNDELKHCFCDDIFFSKHGNGFVWNKFYSASFLKRVNAQFGTERIQQDEAFNLRLYPHVTRLLLSSYKGYNYYLDPKTSTSARFVERKWEAITSVYHALLQFQHEWLGCASHFNEYIQKRYVNSLTNVIFYNFSSRICPWPSKRIIDKLNEILHTPEVQDIILSPAMKQLRTKDAILWHLLKKKKFYLLFFVEKCLFYISRTKGLFK